MAYIGDPVRDFGEYSKKEYRKTSPLDITKMAQRNAGVYPAGLQGYEGVGASPLAITKLAQRNAGVKPAGLQGYEDYSSAGADPFEVTQLAQRNAGVYPAGLQGYYEGFGGTSPLDITRLAQRNAGVYPAGLQGYEGFEGASPLEITKLAQRNAGVYPAGLQGLGFLGGENLSTVSHLAVKNRNSHPAGSSFGELGGENLSTVSHMAVKARNAHPAGSSFGDVENSAFDGYGDLGSATSWDYYFGIAASAQSEPDITSAFKSAVASVPDNTPASIKVSYYQNALKMLNDKKSGGLYHLNPQRVELQANLGWLINPNIPKTGGFDAAIGKAIGALGANLAKNTSGYTHNQKLMAMGEQLKNTLRKTTGLSGFGQSSITEPLFWLGLGVVSTLAACYLVKKTKLFKKRKR